MSPVKKQASPTTAEIRRGMVMEGSPRERKQRAMEEMVRQIEPSLHGKSSKFPVYLAFFKRAFVGDTRLFAFDVSGNATWDGKVRLKGYAEYPEEHQTLTDFLKCLGFTIADDQIIALPAAGLGDTPFALVKATHTTLYDRPDKPRENMSEALLGDPLFLLMSTEDGNYYLCHSADGYVGYVAAADVMRVNAAELTESQSLPRATVTRSCVVDDVPVPAGTHLHVHDGRVDLPGGKNDLILPADSVQVTDEKQYMARITPILEAARGFMGTKYVWGAKTLDGIDCSGLVQTAYQTQGIRLPRDADQQAYVGQLVGTRWYRSGLRAGDSLFFLSGGGRVSHTALYIGDQEYIEASGPGVKMTSFDPKSPAYDPHRDKTFCFAKRVLD
jgi:hypothetical protein